MNNKQVCWGIVGPGSIANNFAEGIAAADNAKLVAVYGRTALSRDEFAKRHGIDGAKGYDNLPQLLSDSDVDAIYISTTHPTHAQMSLDALAAGKHVICEKPAGVNVAQMRAIVHAAGQANRFFMEGFMYLCHPQIARLLEILKEGRIGELRHIDSRFFYDAPFDASSRLFDPEQAGGGILDVGCYPVSFARLIAGVATGEDFADPSQIFGTGWLAPSGADQAAFCFLGFANGVTASCGCGTTGYDLMGAEITGTKGRILLDRPFDPGRDEGPADIQIVVEVDGERTVEEVRFPHILFAAEAQAASAAILAGRLEAPAPAMSWQGSVGNAMALQRWRDDIGYELPGETAEAPALGKVVVQSEGFSSSRREIEGVDKAVSKLVIGCDNQERYSDAAMIWDAWLEAGGNAFDTAFNYNMGKIETMLGKWMSARGVRDEVVLVVKGCHTPWCDPAMLKLQLEMSLDRLQTGHGEMYMLHRDNPSIPVGEFIDAMNEVADASMVSVLGASNWTLQRFMEANEWAKANGRRPMTAYNNNLALATMIKAPWPGCYSSNNPETLAYLNEGNIVHLSWSSQARGYFLEPGMRSELDEDSGPERCFGGPDNAIRRERAAELANEKGVTPTNIAAAWVLSQRFPSFALFGPRNPTELATTLPALGIELSAAEVAWLNLESDGR